MTGAKLALLVGNSDYKDARFARLRAPAHDVDALSRVLSNPRIGGFDVHKLLNEQSWVISEEIEGLFADRRRDDLLLLYISCHGVKDASGRLHFAATNTRFERLGSTGISATWVNEQVDRSLSRRIVLLLDCCYSGSFARGLAPRGARGVEVIERFGGRGRAVITASDSMEYAYEGDDLMLEAAQPSLFTRAVVTGLETGEADLNGDGRVAVDELYSYVYDSVRKGTPSQTPTMSSVGLQGELYLAQNPQGVRPVELNLSTTDNTGTQGPPVSSLSEGQGRRGLLVRLLMLATPRTGGARAARLLYWLSLLWGVVWLTACLATQFSTGVTPSNAGSFLIVFVLGASPPAFGAWTLTHWLDDRKVARVREGSTGKHRGAQ